MNHFFDKLINFIKKYKTVLLVVLIAVGLFYWFQLRPSFIKTSCYNEATNKAIEKGKTIRGITDGRFNKDDYDAYYKICLQKNGL